MYFDLDELPIEILKRKKNLFDRPNLIFSYEGKTYYYKEKLAYEYYYNEVIAEKLARQAGISCAHYHLGCFGGADGIVSEAIDIKNYCTMKEFLEKNNRGSRKSRNTFENIWQTFAKVFSEETTEKLMDKLVNIFLFDVIIGNPDRNLGNYGLIITENSIDFAPLIDNESMTFDETIKKGYYDLSFEGISKKENVLYYFLDISDTEYQERLKKLLPLISEENIRKIFWELEREGIKIDIDLKLRILKKFATNRQMIENYFTEKPKTYQITK